ncbi:MAG: CCA tRNA nucleotidyltransferase [Dehalococcoidia bacterium]|nr:CCA tRNA nucleotidyltransferase [Dehalococcoidia bacterium]
MTPNDTGVPTQEQKATTGINQPLLKVKAYLSGQEIESYLVGGYLRDMLLGRDSSDIDIAIDADALQTAQNIAQAIKGTYVPLDEKHQIARIILHHDNKHYTIDISTLRGNIESDLSHRDFTVNAIAINLTDLSADSSTTHIIDPFKGQTDINNKIIKVVSKTSLQEDPIRMLRAVRLAAELRFTLDSKTESLISNQSNLLLKTAGERVHTELCRLMHFPKTHHWLRVMDKLGLMSVIIPELDEAKGVEQPIEHFWDVFDHSIETVKAVEHILYRGKAVSRKKEPVDFVPWSHELDMYFEEQISGNLTRKELIKVAALLHDVAKPQTRSFAEHGRVHFFGHPQKGSEIAGDILTRLRFSKRETKMAQKMIELHMRPGQMNQPGELPTRRAIYRYFRDAGDVAIDTLFLNLADHLSARGPQLDINRWQEHADMVEYVITKSQREKELTKPHNLINGHAIMTGFNLNPGPYVGELLEKVREMQATGEITTTKEALTVVQKILTSTAENN